MVLADLCFLEVQVFRLYLVYRNYLLAPADPQVLLVLRDLVTQPALELLTIQ